MFSSLADYSPKIGDNMETMAVSEVPCLQKFKGRPSAKSLIFWEKTGAGEGIRTLDPNLGKVVLYP